jgi:hypothetical protein
VNGVAETCCEGFAVQERSMFSRISSRVRNVKLLCGLIAGVTCKVIFVVEYSPEVV